MDPQTDSYSMPFVSAASVSTNGGNDIGGPRVDMKSGGAYSRDVPPASSD
jgi:hypothetical protein